MASTQDLQIITIYTAGKSKGSRNRVRILASLSLAVAAVWLIQVSYPKRVLGYNTVDRWVKGKLMLAALSQSTGAMGEAEPDLRALLKPPPTTPEATDAEATPADQEAAARQYTQHMRVLVGGFYIWKAIAILAGGWLALAGLVGLTGHRVGVILQRQAAVLILLSTLATVVGILVAIKWGGMPRVNDVLIYVKIAAVQSAYAWILLIVTPFLR
jgi:hypothetical protein